MLATYYQKFVKSLKFYFFQLYYFIFGKTYIEIDDLINPSREDINLRVDFIKNYLLIPNSKVEESEYYKFLINLNKHPYYISTIDIDYMIEKFSGLYSSIKNSGYQPEKFGYITVEKVHSRMRFVYPYNGQIIQDGNAETEYILCEGAHRLAILKYLNNSIVKCKRVYTKRNQVSNYSSFIKSYRDAKENKINAK